MDKQRHHRHGPGEELVFDRQSIGLRLLKDAVIESGREIVFEELVEKPLDREGQEQGDDD